MKFPTRINFYLNRELNEKCEIPLRVYAEVARENSTTSENIEDFCIDAGNLGKLTQQVDAICLYVRKRGKIYLESHDPDPELRRDCGLSKRYIEILSQLLRKHGYRIAKTKKEE